MARLFWVSAACLAFLAPLSLAAAKDSGTPQATAASTPATTPSKTPAPTQSPTAIPAVKATPAAATGTAKTVSRTAASDANHKSEALAEVLAWVPGIAIHGAGHMYAGSWMHGLGLFALEGACAYEGAQVINRGNFTKFNVSGGKIPTDLSGAETDVGISLVCAMGVLWTWLDDVSGATVAVDDYNKLQDQAAAGPHAQLRLLPTRDGAMLALSTQF